MPLTPEERARTRTWIMRLHGVNPDRHSGRAFTGEWAQFGSTVEADTGEHFLSYVEQVPPSGNLKSRTVRLYRVAEPDGLVAVAEWRLDDREQWMHMIRDDLARIIDPPPTLRGGLTVLHAFRSVYGGELCELCPRVAAWAVVNKLLRVPACVRHMSEVCERML